MTTQELAIEAIKKLPGEECTRLVDMLEMCGYKIRKQSITQLTQTSVCNIDQRPQNRFIVA